MMPETRYAKSGKLSIAYQVVGDGPINLVVVPGWISNIEVFWEDPHVARFFEKLATFARLILFDKRGTGLSDRNIEAATLEERMDDMRTVLDAVGCSRAALLGYSEGGTMCVLFAATYPDRTAALVTIGSYARRLRAPDYPYFTGREEAVAAVEAAAADWGGPVWIDVRIPSVAADPIIRQWWARFLRMSASASAAAALQRMNLEIDVRHVLPSIQAPTLILHAKDDRAVPVGASRPVREFSGRVSRQIAPQTPESAQIQSATKKATEVLGQATEEAREQVAQGRPTLNLTILNGWLERFPTIHLVVQPVPPRDYNVAINGEDCPTTEKSLYKVPFGRVEIRVERTGKPACLWSGQLIDGRTQEVACNF